MTAQRRLAYLLPSAAGSMLGVAFGAAAVLRRSKPLHPKGTVWDAVLYRTGTAGQWGSAWLDQPGEDRGLARLSRAVGVPAPVPDILGLALMFGDAEGPRHDLLLASTGLRRITRFVLLPRQNPARTTYTCLFPYAARRGPVVLAAAPIMPPQSTTPSPPRSDPASRLTFRMLAASPGGRWQPFGRLELAARADDGPDLPLRFDPIVNPLPDLGYYPALRRLREPAYTAARRFGPAVPLTGWPAIITGTRRRARRY